MAHCWPFPCFAVQVSATPPSPSLRSKSYIPWGRTLTEWILKKDDKINGVENWTHSLNPHPWLTWLRANFVQAVWVWVCNSNRSHGQADPLEIGRVKRAHLVIQNHNVPSHWRGHAPKRIIDTKYRITNWTSGAFSKFDSIQRVMKIPENASGTRMLVVRNIFVFCVMAWNEWMRVFAKAWNIAPLTKWCHLVPVGGQEGHCPHL